LGAKRFEPLYHVILANISALEGDGDEALAVAEKMVVVSRETGPKFSGPLSLGVLALVDAMRMRGAPPWMKGWRCWNRAASAIIICGFTATPWERA
jgi:hypothetical protein